MHTSLPSWVIRYRSIRMAMSGSTSSGRGPNCENDVKGQQRTLALHKRSVRTSHRLLRIGQTVLLTPQKNGSGACTTPLTFLRQAVYRRYQPSGA
jgi:hypothetical protein